MIIPFKKIEVKLILRVAPDYSPGDIAMAVESAIYKCYEPEDIRDVIYSEAKEIA